MPIAEKAAQLRSLVRHDVSSVPRLPSKELFEARRVFIGACGMGMDLVHDPFVRMTEVAASFYNSQALRIAAEIRIADALFVAKILRTLSSLHIFAEVEENFYSNTNTSQHLVNNEPLRCWHH